MTITRMKSDKAWSKSWMPCSTSRLYAKYKTALTPEEREEARQRYLDERGIPQSYRWTTSPWEL